MRLLLPFLALAPALLPQEPASPLVIPPGLDAQPPARFALRCGESAVEFSDGARFTLPAAFAGQECALERLPLRRFEYPSAVAFDYPDGAQWLAATHVPAFCWWDVVAYGEMIAVQRHVGTGDAAHHRNLYAENSLKCGGTDLGECTITLDGRVLTGRRVSGRSDRVFTQEIYSFEHAGATWLVLLHSDQPDPAPFDELGSAPVAPAALRDRFLTSFRFL